MSENAQLCQISNPREFSRLAYPRFFARLRRLMWHIRHDGIQWTVKRATRFASSRVLRLALGGTRATGKQTGERVGEVLNLRSGEWVEVKSAEEIAATLDANGRHRGLTFLPEMRSYCGRSFPVYKRLEKMFMEESGHNRSLKNTVLLSGVVCDGAGYGCDRSCLFYWREVWLRRVDGRPLEHVERG